ncbi:hypothetical protein KC352_g41708, partial [Hortaea werneckii]
MPDPSDMRCFFEGGSAGVLGPEEGDAAALCINFIAMRRFDISFGWTFFCAIFVSDMSEELQDEVTSITSIYGEESLSRLSQDPAIYSLVIPAQPSISIRIEFPTKYPDVPPSILGTQHIGDNVAKGDGAFLVDLLRETVAEIYIPGPPCLFDLIEESNAKLHALGLDQSTAAK